MKLRDQQRLDKLGYLEEYPRIRMAHLVMQFPAEVMRVVASAWLDPEM